MPTKRKGTPRSLVAGPSDAELRQLLGRRYALFNRVAHPRPGVAGEWRSYKKGAPPVLKVLDGNQTLYYVRPDSAAVHVSLVVSRRACEGALAARLPAHLRAAIASAPVFPEGRAVRLALHRMAEAADVDALLAVKLGRS
jgi:hypothetical protein